MEAGEFIESLETAEQGNAPNQEVEPRYPVTIRLTDAEHTMLQRLKELTGRDDSTALRTGLRLFAAMMESGDSVLQEIARKELG